jgi:hypothetical protein
VLAARPPRDTGHARHLAAEQMVFCDECAGRGLRDVLSITRALLASPIWTFADAIQLAVAWRAAEGAGARGCGRMTAVQGSGRASWRSESGPADNT